MLQTVLGFLTQAGFSEGWSCAILLLFMTMAGLSAKRLKYKVEEVEKNGKKEYRIYKIH